MVSTRDNSATTEIRKQPERDAVFVNLGWGDGTLMEQTGCKSKEMQRLEKFRHAITMLRVNGYMPTSQSNKMREKLTRAIRAELAAIAKAEGK